LRFFSKSYANHIGIGLRLVLDHLQHGLTAQPGLTADMVEQQETLAEESSQAQAEKPDGRSEEQPAAALRGFEFFNLFGHEMLLEGGFYLLSYPIQETSAIRISNEQKTFQGFKTWKV
jgi:hypothetical protein